jgi:hypothetical protein
MKLILLQPVIYLASTFVIGCQVISTANASAGFPFYASIPEAQAIAAGQFGAFPIELPAESDIELVGAVDCNATVSKVRSRAGRQGWIPVNDLPKRLQSSRNCPTETANRSPEKSNSSEPPSAN